MKTQYPMIPFPLIVKATDGDTEAINQILHHYRGYRRSSASEIEWLEHR